jgi:hypothetical protein
MPKKRQSPARPRDLNQLAVHVGKIATHETEDVKPELDQKAIQRGEARAAKLSPKRRKANRQEGGHGPLEGSK